jgi:arylsulfatase A-like enzyme
MPLVLAGAGIRSGQRFEYAEQIDIVPTLCFLMGANPPENADGRILAEALVEPPKQVAPRRHQIRELNELIVSIETKLQQLRRKAQTAASLKRAVEEARREFYGLERILDWQRFSTVERLLTHNRAVLERLEAAEREVR